MITGNNYLIKSVYGIQKCKCLCVTKKCYQIKWENGNSVWLFKSQFDGFLLNAPEYEIIEELI